MPKQEDTRKDLYLWQITEQTMLTLEERLNIQCHLSQPSTTTTPATGMCMSSPASKASSTNRDFKALRDSATDAALSQRQERDLARQAKIRSIEEVQWAY